MFHPFSHGIRRNLEMDNSGIVYIVHHVDTEGPLYESMAELFGRLKLIFGIDVAPTSENLLKIQNGEMALPEAANRELMAAAAPHTVTFKKDWHEIDEMLLRITSPQFRNKLQDSFGDGWIYNWHVMDHVGFTLNPRHRDMGFLNIFEFYEKLLRSTSPTNDRIHWHFHPVSFFHEAHIPATCYDTSLHILHKVISIRLIEKEWFPVVNRAGFHAIRPDSNLFLEQWLPFDASNIATDDDVLPKHQTDLANGRYGDWRGAPTDWRIYQPDYYDWRKSGSCNRSIARVLNLKARHRSINCEEIEKAFDLALSGQNVYLGITNHDFREMSVEIDDFRELLRKVISKRTARIKFSESIEAFRAVMGFSTEEISRNAIDMDVHFVKNTLQVSITNGEPFGPQPYLAIKTIWNDYFHDNFDFQNFKKMYSYTFDNYTIPLDRIDTIGIASNDKYGNTSIILVHLQGGEVSTIRKAGKL